MRYILLTVIGLLLMSTNAGFASGPSMIFSKVEPLAINSKGDILCKSFYSQNPSGARSFYDTDAEVSLCIVKKGEIRLWQTLDQFKANQKSTNYESEAQAYNAISARYDQLEFSGKSTLLEPHYEELVQQGFKALVLDKYRLEPHFSVNNFYEKWGYHYQNLEQVVLEGKSVPEIFADFDANKRLKTVELQYQIGNQIWLLVDDCPVKYSKENKCAGDWPLDDNIRATYYISPLYEQHKNGGIYGDNPAPFGYEYQKVNAIIFLPEN